MKYLTKEEKRLLVRVYIGSFENRGVENSTFYCKFCQVSINYFLQEERTKRHVM